MEITYDPDKNASNIALRGLSFERAAELDFSTAVIWTDTRKAYPEVRISALGCIRWSLPRRRTESGSSAFARRTNAR